MSPQDAKAIEISSGLTPTQSQLLFLGILCMEAPLKIDMEKLAAMTGNQVTSARSNFNRALRRLKEVHEAGAVNDADNKGKGDSGTVPSASKKAPKPRVKASRGSKRKRQNEKAGAGAEDSADVEALQPVPSSSDVEALEPVPDSD
ncbi:uncharacterized protein N7484_007748 [Penicillium longicatenatum]|uniref:uncharacterized protein n=1 Tax=Penicillium longicatenatum TaxID=1561947 RepID=UPI002549B06D|nr:uncharacterized protein N7484_007748 [Penicillium longicatenatum]KAJ5639886.1 hypothetical protein N7484_007748 [Penicillium longicatenatum]